MTAYNVIETIEFVSASFLISSIVILNGEPTTDTNGQWSPVTQKKFKLTQITLFQMNKPRESIDCVSLHYTFINAPQCYCAITFIHTAVTGEHVHLDIILNNLSSQECTLDSEANTVVIS